MFVSVQVSSGIAFLVAGLMRYRRIVGLDGYCLDTLYFASGPPASLLSSDVLFTFSKLVSILAGGFLALSLNLCP